MKKLNRLLELILEQKPRIEQLDNVLHVKLSEYDLTVTVNNYIDDKIELRFLAGETVRKVLTNTTELYDWFIGYYDRENCSRPDNKTLIEKIGNSNYFAMLEKDKRVLSGEVPYNIELHGDYINILAHDSLQHTVWFDKGQTEYLSQIEPFEISSEHVIEKGGKNTTYRINYSIPVFMMKEYLLLREYHAPSTIQVEDILEILAKDTENSDFANMLSYVRLENDLVTNPDTVSTLRRNKI